LKDIEGNLEVKLPTIWTDGKAGLRAVREEKESEERRRRRAKGGKVAKHGVVPDVLWLQRAKK
jgi:hypothetical protein